MFNIIFIHFVMPCRLFQGLLKLILNLWISIFQGGFKGWYPSSRIHLGTSSQEFNITPYLLKETLAIFHILSYFMDRSLFLMGILATPCGPMGSSTTVFRVMWTKHQNFGDTSSFTPTFFRLNLGTLQRRIHDGSCNPKLMGKWNKHHCLGVSSPFI